MALDSVGHRRWGILEGGFDLWAAEDRPLTAALPQVEPTHYPAPAGNNGFTVGYRDVQAALEDGRTLVLDSRPADYFTGAKSDEARPGHIPGAINRPYSEDVDDSGGLLPAADLKAAYGKLIPSPETPIIVHCRTGHQASQTYFVLKHVLGHENVRFYDAGWTQWAALPNLPAET
jgi:thiosulfate/3-mercaptopyruvate sulfurtransferase